MISHDPDMRLRDLAAACGLTERAVRAIVGDLEHAGYLTHTRKGRRNCYQIVPGTLFRHPAEAHYEVAGLLDLLADGPQPTGRPELDGIRGDDHDRENALP